MEPPPASFALQPGDSLPDVTLRDGDGEAVSLYRQTIAGRPLVVVFGDPAPWRAVADAFAAIETTLMLIDAADEGAALALADPGGKLAQALGAESPTVFVVDAASRLVARLPATPATVDAAQTLCAELWAATPKTVLTQAAPALLIPDVLDPDLCETLMALWAREEKLKGGVSTGTRESGGTSYDAGIKQRLDVPVAVPELVAALRTRLAGRVLPAIQRAFQYRATQHETFRVGCYVAPGPDAPAGGDFRRHRDNSTPYTQHRRFAMSANLNEDYDGGELRFPEFGRGAYRPPAGGAVIFSCGLLHEALEVTRGRRFGLFTFLFGEAEAREVQRLLATERADGRVRADADVGAGA